MGKSASGGRLPYPISMPLPGDDFKLWNAFHQHSDPTVGFRRGTFLGGGLLGFCGRLHRVGEGCNPRVRAALSYAVITAAGIYIVYGPSQRLMSTAATGQP